MGKGKRSRAETQAHDLSSRQKKNRGRTAGTLGEDTGGEEEVGGVEPTYSKEVARYDVLDKLSAFPKPSQSVFEPHSMVCVESLIFIRDGIGWYRLMIDPQAIPLRAGLPNQNAKEIHHVWPHR